MINWELIYIHFCIVRGHIKKPATCEVYERHHVIPRHLIDKFFWKDANNMLYLSRKDHAFAHYLLWKWLKYIGDKFAYIRLTGRKYNITADPEYRNSEQFKQRNKKLSERLTNNPKLLNKTHICSTETRQKMSNHRKGRNGVIMKIAMPDININ